MTFYMYRATSDENYPIENVNAANLPGVLRYLHDEVVITCPRKHDITKIRRLKVTMYNTQDLHKIPPHAQFGPYAAFEEGRCRVPGCKKLWNRFGFVVGCQKKGTAVAHYVDGIWYSLPGRCPERPFFHKSRFCMRYERGGRCGAPNGHRHCTWNVEDAGEIRLDELEGLTDFNNHCKPGDVAYDPRNDTGTITNFWQGKKDPWTCSQREAKLKALFKQRAAGPADLGTPSCDWWR